MGITADVITFVSVGHRCRRMRVMQGDELLCETSKDVLSAANIDSEDPGSPAGVLEVIDAMEPLVAKERALRLLGHRERTHHELRVRLGDEGLSDASILPVLARLEEIGALSDERFAELYVRSKAASGWGRPRIERALADKGVAPEISQRMLDEFVPVDQERARAYRLAQTRALSTPRERERALARLARKGFAPSDALAAIKDPPPGTV